MTTLKNVALSKNWGTLYGLKINLSFKMMAPHKPVGQPDFKAHSGLIKIKI